MEQNTDPRVLQIGNTTDNPNRDNPNRGQVYDIDGIAPALNCCGGGNREPQILEPITCAMRGRNPENPSDRTAGIPTQQRIELGGDIANCITSVEKDSLVAEPILVKNATRQGYLECPAGGCFEPNYPDSELRRGRVQENGTVAPALTANGEPPWLNEGRIIDYKLMPDGSIRGYNPNTPDKRGISEEQYNSPDSVAGALTTAHEAKVIEPIQYRYRIRKLHPIETYRLMDIDDADIQKLIQAKTPKGKPLIAKSRHYQLAGNSIVVSCMYHIFENLFCQERSSHPIQLTLF